MHAKQYVVRKPEWKRPPGKPRLRRKDNIKIQLEEILREYVNWIHLILYPFILCGLYMCVYVLYTSYYLLHMYSI
jgi:hypothetical protein